MDVIDQIENIENSTIYHESIRKDDLTASIESDSDPNIS